MARRRRSKSSPEQAIAAMVGLVLLGCVVSPLFRMIALALLVLVVAGGIGYIAYRLIVRSKSRDLSDRLLQTSPFAARPPPLPPAPSKPRYAARKSVLTKAEIAFHKVLLAAVPEAPIFPKVRVADVMEAAERYSGDFLRISQKHFDWVLCHPVSFEPLIAIELDDSSHQWSDKQRKNDKVKDDATREAGIVLLRFPWQNSYDVDVVRERISAVLDRIADTKEATAAPFPVKPPPQMPTRSPACTFSANAARDALDEVLRQRRAEKATIR